MLACISIDACHKWIAFYSSVKAWNAERSEIKRSEGDEDKFACLGSREIFSSDASRLRFWFGHLKARK